MSQNIFRRHDLVWLASDPDAGQFAAAAEHAHHVRSWVAQGWPLAVARQPELTAEQGDHITLGFTLPSAPTRKRISVTAPRSGIVRHSRPLSLQDTIDHAPHSWRPAMLGLHELCTKYGVVPRVYGSLSSQALTGAVYLDAASDLDVLLECSASSSLHELLVALVTFPQQTPRIDGEVLLQSGWAVAWRELAAALRADDSRKVLAKSDREARLIPVVEICTNIFPEAA